MQAREVKPEKKDDPFSKGRQQLIAVAVSLVGSIVLLLLIGAAQLGTAVIWTFVFSLLSLQMFRGRNWARWIIVVFALVLGGGNAYSAATLFETVGSSWPINAALVVVYAWCAFILLLSKPVQDFMGDQRAKGR